MAVYRNLSTKIASDSLSSSYLILLSLGISMTTLISPCAGFFPTGIFFIFITIHPLPSFLSRAPFWDLRDLRPAKRDFDFLFSGILPILPAYFFTVTICGKGISQPGKSFSKRSFCSPLPSICFDRICRVTALFIVSLTSALSHFYNHLTCAGCVRENIFLPHFNTRHIYITTFFYLSKVAVMASQSGLSVRLIST